MVDADGLGSPPPAAESLFGAALPRMTRYAQLLASDGVERGLLGPREVPRLWARHLLNCGVMAELLPVGATVVDLGSGAGLPGLVLALQRDDLAVTLLEPLLRRAVFLAECVERLELCNVQVVRDRAENWGSRPAVDIVTARAVAPLDRLAGWGLPLLRPGGVLLAIKGESAADELASAEPRLRALGAREWRVDRVGGDVVPVETTVVRVVRGSADAVESPGARVRGGAKRGRAGNVDRHGRRSDARGRGRR